MGSQNLSNARQQYAARNKIDRDDFSTKYSGMRYEGLDSKRSAPPRKGVGEQDESFYSCQALILINWP